MAQEYEIVKGFYTDSGLGLYDYNSLANKPKIVKTINNQLPDEDGNIEIEEIGGSGEPGFSPTVEFSEVSGGTNLTITDIEGTKTAFISDGKDGRGIDYIDNPDGDSLWIHYTDGNADVVFLPASGGGDPESGGGGGGSGYVQSDWAVNDKSSEAYVKNRTHWVDPNGAILEETRATSYTHDTFGKAWLVETKIHLEVGKTYTVVYNRETYECVCQSAPAGLINDPNAMGMGNFSVVGGANTGEPFAMLISEKYGRVDIIDLVGSANVRVSILGGEVIHKLDSKFLNLDWLPVRAVNIIPEYTGTVEALGEAVYGMEIPDTAGILSTIENGTSVTMEVNGVSYEATKYSDMDGYHLEAPSGTFFITAVNPNVNAAFITTEPGEYTVRVMSGNINKIPVDFLPDDHINELIDTKLEEFEPVIPDSSQNVDLTGYAKETWVQEGFQPKGDYLESAELPTAINTALAQAKASGEFDGKDGTDGKTPIKGTDYFTEADKQEITGQAAALVDTKNTCWVHVTYNSETGVGTTDKTSEEIDAEYNSGKYVVCTAEIDGFPFELVPVIVATPNVIFNCTFDHHNYTLTIRGDVVEFDKITSVISVNGRVPDVYGRINIPIPEAIDGVSPTVDVSKSGKVTTISITDKNGTKTATVNDGVDGADGKDAEGFLRVVLDRETMTADHNALEITEVVSNGGFAYLVVNSAGEMVKLTRAAGSLATFTATGFYSSDGKVGFIEEVVYTVNGKGQVTVSSAIFSDRGSVKSVNGQTPDVNGNVEIIIPDSVDLTGYAKESWVQAGFQPKGSYYTKEEIDTLVENFESSAFIITTDLTTADKTNAEMWEAYQQGRPTYLLIYADIGAFIAQPVSATETKAVFSVSFEGESVTVIIENNSVSVTVHSFADSETVDILRAQVFNSMNSKLDASELPTAIDTALAQAKASGEFKGDKGDTGEDGRDGRGIDYIENPDGDALHVHYTDGNLDIVFLPVGGEIDPGTGGGGGSTTIVQSDWSVNDESSETYVKNRTHWVEGSMGLPECNPDFDSEEGAFYTAASMSLTDGQEITVNWNGVPYKCTVYSFSIETENDAFVFGNSDVLAEMVGIMAEANTAPFAGMYGVNESIIMFLPLDGSTKLTVSVDAGGIVHKLDNQYLDLDWLPVRKDGLGEVIVPEYTGVAEAISEEAGMMEIPNTAGILYSIENGTTVYVEINGTTYKTTRAVNMDGYYLAEYGYVSEPGSTANPPLIGGKFMFWSIGSSANISMFVTEPGEYTVRIGYEGNINKIPADFLPDDHINELIDTKLDANKLPEAINIALAQAKASGEFKGDKGDKGDTGATGPAYTLTSADKTAIVNAVIAALPVYNGEVL